MNTERGDSIFERLRRHGYHPEIERFGRYAITQACLEDFEKSDAVTDREWDQMLPEWLEVMDSFRSEWSESSLRKQRMLLLESEYANYVASPPANAPEFDLLPDMIDLASFPPFQDVISAPEGAEVDARSFESAFEQLPAFVEEWKTRLAAELAEMVKIPVRYGVHFEPARKPTGIDKLRLACAVFNTQDTVTHFPEVFSSLYHLDDRNSGQDIQHRFQICFVEEAAYVVFACGLDPTVATVEDMDRRNPRLQCMFCPPPQEVLTWRDALLHVQYCETPWIDLPPHEFLRWTAISPRYRKEIEAVEASYDRNKSLPGTRCLMCRPCIGDEKPQYDIVHHIVGRHGVRRDAVQLGEHFVSVNMEDGHGSVEVVEREGRLSFGQPVFDEHRIFMGMVRKHLQRAAYG